MPVSEKKRITNDRYTSTCDCITLHPRKEIGSRIRTAAKSSGTSLQGYILRAVREQMRADGFAISDRMEAY